MDFSSPATGDQIRDPRNQENHRISRILWFAIADVTIFYSRETLRTTDVLQNTRQKPQNHFCQQPKTPKSMQNSDNIFCRLQPSGARKDGYASASDARGHNNKKTLSHANPNLRKFTVSWLFKRRMYRKSQVKMKSPSPNPHNNNIY